MTSTRTEAAHSTPTAGPDRPHGPVPAGPAAGAPAPLRAAAAVERDRVVDECAVQSFPASDPPSWWAGG